MEELLNLSPLLRALRSFVDDMHELLSILLVGIPSPATWGLVMAILDMLPVIGTNTLLLPLLPFGNYMLATALFFMIWTQFSESYKSRISQIL